MKTYMVYWMRMLKCAFVAENKIYYAWLAMLAGLVGLGAMAYIEQATHGFAVTNISDQVPWGAYIANFTFLVGVADAAVLLVFPTYVLHREDVQEVVLIGVLMAFTAMIMCLCFILIDLGRPDRFLHVMPLTGILNFPSSVLAWDVLVVNGYLFMNMYIPGYLLYMRYLNKKPSEWAYKPLVMVSIAWAVGLHTVTAFLYAGLGGRPFWNTAILAPRFLVTSFAGGPAILIVVFGLITHFTNFKVRPQVFELLKKIAMVFLPINLFLLGSELFVEFYAGTHHSASARYLFFGLHGHTKLVPYIWSAVAMNLFATTVFYWPRLRNNWFTLSAACLLAFVGIWIEKGMGLLVPGFVPTPLGEVVEYTPSLVEIFICLGVWSLGALIFTVLSKVAIAIQTGDLNVASSKTDGPKPAAGAASA